MPFRIGLSLLKKRKPVWTKAVPKYVLTTFLTGASGKRVGSCLQGGGGMAQGRGRGRGRRKPERKREKKLVSRRGEIYRAACSAVRGQNSAAIPGSNAYGSRSPALVDTGGLGNSSRAQSWGGVGADLRAWTGRVCLEHSLWEDSSFVSTALPNRDR